MHYILIVKIEQRELFQIFQDRSCEIDRNRKYVGYQKVLASMAYTYFDKKKKTESGVSINEQLAEKLNKPVIKKFKRRIVYVTFLDNI